MKFSTAQWCPGGWYENVRQAKEHGFKATEMLSWNYLDTDEAAEFLRKNDMLNTSLIIESKDEKLNSSYTWEHGIVYEDVFGVLEKAMIETAEVAKKWHSPNIIVTTGYARHDVSREKQVGNVIEGLKIASDIAADAGVNIVLEPLNVLVDHAGYLLTTSSEANDIIEKVDRKNCYILFDIYHQQITEGNLINNIGKYIDHIGHFHIADNPGRKQPGTGEINYENVFAFIKSTGYDKWLAFECGTTVEPEQVLSEMRAFTSKFES